MSTTKEESIKETVKVLINALHDKENTVNNVVIKSLCKISNTYPNEVIEIFCDFYKSTAKVNSAHLGNIIKVLEQTCVNQIKKLNLEVVRDLVGAMLRAMTQSIDNEAFVQMGASSVLVAAGHMYLDMVLRTLIAEIIPSSVPHYSIPHTLGRLAASATYDTVPHIKEILSKMLPLLPLVKAHAVKQAFSYAFGQFAVAVTEQIGDNFENDNITGIKENFVVEFSIIFDVLYNQWILSSEPKVTESVLEALGPITRLISERKFDEIINKFVLILLSMYKKTAINSYCISQCISYLLSPSPLNPKLTLNDNVINATNHTLFTLVCIEPDYDQPHTIKNHFEVLRCFDHMAEQFPDATIESVMHQCKNNQEKERMKAVIVLTHLTTSSQYFIDKYSGKFIAILKVMTIMEQNLKMKKLIVKAIVGLVYRNCICSSEDFAMVEFIVKNCAFEGAPNVPKEDVSELQDTCRSSLVLMCNTVTSVHSQLRSLLLTSLTLEELTPSMSTVSNCLINLLQSNSEILPETEKDGVGETIDKLKVSPELIFIRCIVHIVDPAKIDRNKNLLLFLEEYSGDIHRNLKNSWTVEIQRLLKYVEKNESMEQWHAMLLDLLVSAIGEVNSNKWTENISTALSNQILKTKQSPMVKGMSLQYLAIISCHLSNAAIVENVLKIILFSLKSIPMESCDFVSKAIGIASRQHGEHILNQLDQIYKDMDSRKSSKILNFISARHSKSDAEINVVKYAVITCYGKVAEQSLDVHVLARLGDHVTNILLELLKSNPSMDLCRATITTLYQISKALLPASHHNVALRNRWQLLNAVLEQIFNPNLEKRNIELLPIIVKASKGLTKLQKGILPEERNTILRVLFNCIFNELANTRKNDHEGADVQNEVITKTINESLGLLHQLVRELIIQSTCLSTIDDLVSLLIEWLNHEVDEIRTATIQIFYVIFDAYIKNVRLNYETPSKFGQMGYLLGLIVPGIGDTNFQVRLSTVDCVKLIIQIQDLYEGRTVEPDDKCMEMLSSYHNDLMTNDLDMVAEFCKSLCACIYEKIPHNYTMQFIESLLESFNSDEHRCTAIGALLETLLVKRGSDLYQNVERILEVILSTMDGVSESCGRKLLPAVKSLCRFHGNAVTAVLLIQRLPFKLSVVSTWRHLACDEQLSFMIVEDFLTLMSTIELFEDPYNITENHIASLQSLTIISALGEMLQETACSTFCIKKFPELFALLFTTLVVYMDAVAPAYSIPHNKYKEKFGYIPNREAARLSPARIALDTFNKFLVRADCCKVKEAYAHCLNLDGDSTLTLLDLVPVISSALCRECPQNVPRVVTSLAPYAKSSLPPHRCAVIAFFGELLACRCNDNECLTTTVMATLNFGCKDNHERVRATSLRAIANIVHLKSDQISQYLPMALGPLSQGVDEQAVSSPLDNVPLAAIQGLSRLLTDVSGIDKENHRELMSISQKIRPFMNTDCSQLRESSIRLFGILANIMKSENLIEHGLWTLPCFLLHLCDSTPAVVRASKYTLKQVFKIFNVKKSYEMVQNHLLDEGKLYIEEFMPALLKALAEEMPTCVPTLIHQSGFYLVSNRDDLRPYAPLLIGTLYAEMHRIRSSNEDITVELDKGVTKTARNTLIHLVSDQTPAVRQHAAAALANVCLYELL